MITKEQIAGLLLEACPSFNVIYSKYDEEDKGLYFSLAGDFARHLLSLHLQNKVEDFDAVGILLEKLHIDGDEYVKNLAIIGILEGIQNVWGNNKAAPEEFHPYLLPISQYYWEQLNDFWDAKISYIKKHVSDD